MLKNTKGKILQAAIAEFAAHGYAGARIDRIASRAEVNKRMIYHHFGGKSVVFEAVLSDRLAAAGAVDSSQGPLWLPAPLPTELIRLWMHEALERGDDNIVNLSERSRLAAERVEAVREAQARGDFPRELDAALLTLALVAMEVFPAAFPQLVRVITGQRSTAREFRQGWHALLQGWHGPGERGSSKPRLRLSRERVSQSARSSVVTRSRR